MTIYTDDHRRLHAEFGTEPLAELLDTHIVHDTLTESDIGFIVSRDMFFLSTVGADGFPTVSYKGGPVGFVRPNGERTLAFPGYDGNGMFLSAGNIAGQGKVGLLFIDFETPHRLRVQGRATLLREHALMAEFPEAQYLIVVEVDKLWVNCPRYIHKHVRAETSRYVPAAGRETPLAAWKRLDIVQGVLGADDQRRAAAEGLLDFPAYEAKVGRGEA